MRNYRYLFWKSDLRGFVVVDLGKCKRQNTILFSWSKKTVLEKTATFEVLVAKLYTQFFPVYVSGQIDMYVCVL